MIVVVPEDHAQKHRLICITDIPGSLQVWKVHLYDYMKLQHV